MTYRPSLAEKLSLLLPVSLVLVLTPALLCSFYFLTTSLAPLRSRPPVLALSLVSLLSRFLFLRFSCSYSPSSIIEAHLTGDNAFPAKRRFIGKYRRIR